MMRFLPYKLTLLILMFSSLPLTLFGYVMGSSGYRIDSDSVNMGGNNSVSTVYGLEDTIGEVATGISSSGTYTLNAGYQSMHSSYIAISSVHNGSMTSINGVLGGTTNASTTWNVITDNSAGYQLSIVSATSPALKAPGNASFDDYSPSGSDPDFSYTYSSSESRFGFTPEGIDVAARYRDNGSLCGTGGLDTIDHCWDGLSTTTKIIAEGAASNHPTGATTTVKYRAAVGTQKIQDSGNYSATITVTAVTL